MKRKTIQIKFADIDHIGDVVDQRMQEADSVAIVIQPNGDAVVQLCNEQDTTQQISNIRFTTDLPPTPPQWAQYCLLLIPRKSREHLIGDLEEEFRMIVLPQYGPRKAACWYWWNVVLSIAPFGIHLLKRILGFAVILKLIAK